MADRFVDQVSRRRFLAGSALAGLAVVLGRLPLGPARPAVDAIRDAGARWQTAAGRGIIIARPGVYLVTARAYGASVATRLTLTRGDERQFLAGVVSEQPMEQFASAVVALKSGDRIDIEPSGVLTVGGLDA